MEDDLHSRRIIEAINNNSKHLHAIDTRNSDITPQKTTLDFSLKEILPKQGSQ